MAVLGVLRTPSFRANTGAVQERKSVPGMTSKRCGRLSTGVDGFGILSTGVDGFGG